MQSIMHGSPIIESDFNHSFLDTLMLVSIWHEGSLATLEN